MILTTFIVGLLIGIYQLIRPFIDISDKQKKTEKMIIVTSAIIFILISICSFFIGKKNEDHT
ncbi:MAG: hypothetical protein RLZZ316_626, partial [Bacteroidota bacterium]